MWASNLPASGCACAFFVSEVLVVPRPVGIHILTSWPIVAFGSIPALMRHFLAVLFHWQWDHPYWYIKIQNMNTELENRGKLLLYLPSGNFPAGTVGYAENTNCKVEGITALFATRNIPFGAVAQWKIQMEDKNVIVMLMCWTVNLSFLVWKSSDPKDKF